MIIGFGTLGMVLLTAMAVLLIILVLQLCYLFAFSTHLPAPSHLNIPTTSAKEEEEEEEDHDRHLNNSSKRRDLLDMASEESHRMDCEDIPSGNSYELQVEYSNYLHLSGSEEASNNSHHLFSSSKNVRIDIESDTDNASYKLNGEESDHDQFSSPLPFSQGAEATTLYHNDRELHDDDDDEDEVFVQLGKRMLFTIYEESIEDLKQERESDRNLSGKLNSRTISYRSSNAPFCEDDQDFPDSRSTSPLFSCNSSPIHCFGSDGQKLGGLKEDHPSALMETNAAPMCSFSSYEEGPLIVENSTPFNPLNAVIFSSKGSHYIHIHQVEECPFMSPASLYCSRTPVAANVSSPAIQFFSSNIDTLLSALEYHLATQPPSVHTRSYNAYTSSSSWTLATTTRSSVHIESSSSIDSSSPRQALAIVPSSLFYD